VYPNPVKDKVIVRISEDLESGYVIGLVDMAGKFIQVRSFWNPLTNELEIDLTDLKPGLHFIKLYFGETFKTFTILKR